jgi:hypothetical protein
MDFNPDGYVFFPVYEYYDRSSMGIRSIMAKDLADGIPMMPIIPGSETYELNLQKQERLKIGGLRIDLSLGSLRQYPCAEFRRL